jgi:protoporphyrinogen oxidase
MRHHTAVIGGGISGLASALRIASLGHRVTLLEGEDFLGGLGTTFPYEGGHLERFYHCILPEDTALLALIDELGLTPELQWKRTAMGFMYRRRLYPLNTPMDLLRFTPLSLIERLRLGLMGLNARRNGSSAALDGVPVGEWLTRQIGERAFRILWRPLLESKIGDRHPGIPALWLASRMSREKNTGPEVKGCLTRGYRSLIDTFEAALRERGVELRMRTRVRAIERDGERMRLRLEDDSTADFDAVVATSPLPQFQRMTAGLGLDPRLAELQLDYQGVVSGVFLLREPLSRYYWMPIVDSGATTQGVIEMSNLVPLARSNGLHVTYLVNYTHRTSALFQKSDAEMLALHRADLASLFPEAGRSVVDQFVFRAPFVEPIWTLNYSQVRPPTTVLPGRLYLACTAQVYPRINSWNSCCEVVAGMMTEYAAHAAELESRESATRR